MKRLSKIFFALILIFTALNAKGLTFKLPTVQGKTIEVSELKNGLDFKDFKGKVVLLEFWGTHCPPCLYSINKYKQLLNEYKDKVAMVAIEVQMTPRDKLKEFVKRAGINYNVVAQEDARSFIAYVAQRAQWRGSIPFLIVLDRNGEVLDIKTGFSPNEFEHIRAIIKYAYKEKSANKENNNTKDVNNTDTNSTKKVETKKDNNSTK